MSERIQDRCVSAIELSVVIPTKNRSRQLKRALEPFHGADGPLEVIVVDDGSDDPHRNENRNTCRQLHHCRYVSLSVGKGASVARNEGLRLSRGSSIWFLDDDDYTSRSTLKEILAAVTRNSQHVTLIPRMIVHDGTPLRIDFPADEPDKWQRYRRWGVEVTTSCAVFPKILLERLEGWDESLPALQDTDLFLRAARIAKFRVLDTEPVRVDVASPARITNSFLRSQVGKWRFLRKHWTVLPGRRRLSYLAQIAVCSPLWRAFRVRCQLASAPASQAGHSPSTVGPS